MWVNISLMLSLGCSGCYVPVHRFIVVMTLGPLLFAAGIQGILEDLVHKWNSVWSVWYLDDGSLVGRVENLEGMLAYLEERFRGIGLAINFGKCHILTSYGSFDSFPLLMI